MSFIQDLLDRRRAEQGAAQQKPPVMPTRQPQLPVDAGLAETMLTEQQYTQSLNNTQQRGYPYG